MAVTDCLMELAAASQEFPAELDSPGSGPRARAAGNGGNWLRRLVDYLY
jgi:hypothetical protein